VETAGGFPSSAHRALDVITQSTCFLEESDFNAGEHLLRLAAALKTVKYAGTERPRLTGDEIALIFETSSTRARSAFEVAATTRERTSPISTRRDRIPWLGSARRGGAGRVRRSSGLRRADRRTASDPDAGRCSHHARIEPSPLRLDRLRLHGRRRSNVGRSLLMMGAIIGADVRICGPRELWPPSDVQDLVGERALRSGARLTLADDRKHALDGADSVCTDLGVRLPRQHRLRPGREPTAHDQGDPGRHARLRLTRPYPKRGRMAARARAVPVRASQAATITPNRNPPTWAENATPPPFAPAENRP